LCGLAPSGLSPIAIAADSPAATLGWNVTPTLHDEPPAIVAPQGVRAEAVNVKSPAFAPLITGVASVRVVVPRFATVIVSAFDLVSATFPNASVAGGVSLTGVTPVPESASECGLVGSWPMLTLRVALSTVSELGVKLTAIRQTLLPAQVPLGATPKSAALGPVMPWLSVSVNGERLVTFTVLSVLVADCATLPNANFVGVTVAGIVGPVVSAIV